MAEKMNLVQGLRAKKRVKEMIMKLTDLIRSSNSVIEGGTREVDVLQAIGLRDELKNYLIDLKLALQEASRPIQRDILTISELKDQIHFYRRLDVQHGKSLSGGYSNVEVMHEAIIRKGDVDKYCFEIQKQMDTLFTKIDWFNNSNYIDLEEFPLERFNEVVSAK